MFKDLKLRARTAEVLRHACAGPASAQHQPLSGDVLPLGSSVTWTLPVRPFHR